MAESRNVTIMRPFGIEVTVHWTWLILAFLIASSLAKGWFPQLVPGLTTPAYWIAGVLGAFGLFLSIVVHECCHALVGRAYKMPMEKITLFLFGGVAHMDDEPPSPKAEFLMAIAGPAASLALAFAFAGLHSVVEIVQGAPLLMALMSYLASMNIVVAVFNMIPGYPLDGGRVLRAGLWSWKKDIVWATKIASTFGQGFGVVLILLGLAALLSGQGISGVWSILLGLLVVAFARASYVQLIVKQTLHGKPAEAFMNTKPVVVRPETTIAWLMHEYLQHEDQNIYPIARESGEYVGCVDISSVRKIPETQWQNHNVIECLKDCSEDSKITPDMDAQDAFTQMSKSGAKELVVIKDNRLLGLLSRNSLLKYLSLNTR